jgi:DoxX-like protein
MIETTTAAPDRTRRIAGWVLSVLVSLPFFPSAAFKLMKNPQAIEGLAHVGFAETGVVVLGIVELLVVAAYLIPPTAVLGAVLVTGYVGGILVAHLTMHISLWLPIAIGLVVWLGLWLREPRLRALLPLR